MDQAVAEGHDAVGEVVLRQPGHHALLLHVWTARHIDDEVAQVLPVSEETGATRRDQERRDQERRDQERPGETRRNEERRGEERRGETRRDETRRGEAR